MENNTCYVADGSLALWHQRLGHLNQNDVSKLSKSEHVVTGLKPILGNDQHMDCESCALGKMHRLPFPKQSNSRAEIAHATIHDLCGPMHVESAGGSRYVLTFTDDYSRYSFVYFLCYKLSFLLDFMILSSLFYSPFSFSILHSTLSN